MKILIFLCAFAAVVQARGVRVEFDPQRPEFGPFPTDYLTVPDPAQKTGLRINLPLPDDCNANESTCNELAHLNALDGFNIQARATVKFSGPVNPATLRSGVFYIWLPPARRGEFALGPAGKVTPMNEVVWDPFTNTAYAKPDDFLDQSRSYLLVVTSGVRDLQGDPVEEDEGFRACINRRIGGAYCDALSAALADHAAVLPPSHTVVGGSIFTTLSGTAFMEQARAAVLRSNPSFERVALIEASNVRSIAIRRDVGGGQFTEAELPVSASLVAQSGVGRIVAATIRSPRWTTALSVIPPHPTGSDLRPPAESEQISIYIFLPATPMPPGGYPVVLMGHGIFDSAFGSPLLGGLMASQGVAIATMNAAFHGFGAASAVRVSEAAGGTREIPFAGRSVDFDRNGRIDNGEGCVVVLPGTPVFIRDCLRQTALDYVQLINAFRQGVDVDGDTRRDIGQVVGFIGQSLGGFYGTLLSAIEPDLPAAVLNAGGSSAIPVALWSPGFRPITQAYLGLRRPALLAAGGNFEIPLRYDPPRVLTNANSAAIHDVFERAEWIEAPGAPQTFAPHLKSATLPGVPIKRILFQFAWGDRLVVNPANSALVRAANMRESTSIYRHDRAREVVPALPADPHSHLAWASGIAGVPAVPIGIAAFQQAAGFVLSGGMQIPDANAVVRLVYGRDLFETPETLPERLNFAP